MNPSVLFTYARASIQSRSASGLEKNREEKTSVFGARDILCFRTLASFSASSLFLVPLCIFCPIRYILSLANLRSLPFSCNAMHSPYPFSSLSHLHLLTPLSAGRFLQFRRPFIPQVSLAFSRFFQFCNLTSLPNLRIPG